MSDENGTVLTKNPILEDIPVQIFDQNDLTRLFRLIMETVDVSFALCNTFLDEFGVERVMDIIGQVIPTAYVLNTAYWPFYNSQSTNMSECLCLCRVFNIACPHKFDQNHYINLDKVLPFESEVMRFKKGPGIATILRITVAAKETEEKDGYQVDLNIKTKQEKLINCVDASFRLNFMDACCSSLSELSVVFQPHPMLIPWYGYYIQYLLDFHLYSAQEMPNYYLITSKNMSPFSVVLEEKLIAYSVIKNDNEENSEVKKTDVHMGALNALTAHAN